MPKIILRRDEAVERVTDAFRRFGYDGASLAKIREATGLPASSLYHHFPGGKTDMARAALLHVRERLQGALGDALFGAVEESAGKAEREARVAAFVDVLRAFYRDGALGCLLNRFGAGGAPPDLAPLLQEDVEALGGTIARYCEDVGHTPARARTIAEEVLIGVEGALVLAHASGDEAYFERALGRISSLLAPPVASA